MFWTPTFAGVTTKRRKGDRFIVRPGKLVIGNLIANADVEIGGKSQSFLT
jgi:hypothetical protein